MLCLSPYISKYRTSSQSIIVNFLKIRQGLLFWPHYRPRDQMCFHHSEICWLDMVINTVSSWNHRYNVNNGYHWNLLVFANISKHEEQSNNLRSSLLDTDLAKELVFFSHCLHLSNNHYLSNQEDTSTCKVWHSRGICWGEVYGGI